MRHITLKIYLCSILFMLSSLALSEDCGTVNLLAIRDSPFNKIPVYNQGKINICYAYSAAQMADYHLIKNGSANRNVHPGWVALNYAVSRGRNQLNIGHTKEALDSLKKAGNCDYDVISDALRDWSSPHSSDLDEAKILYSIERSPSKAPVQLLSKITASVCQGLRRNSIFLPPTKTNKKNYNAFIKRRLDEKESPLSISYCSNVWKDQDYNGVTLNRIRPDCKYHESLIVGKKIIAESCHFLVRNTLGTNWTKSNEKLKCNCRNINTGELVDECESSSHSNKDYLVDSCWIPALPLIKNIGRVTFFE